MAFKKERGAIYLLVDSQKMNDMGMAIIADPDDGEIYVECVVGSDSMFSAEFIKSIVPKLGSGVIADAAEAVNVALVTATIKRAISEQ